MISSNQIQKYIKYSVPQLVKKADLYFHKFIRERDCQDKCISCKNGSPEQAGHFYSGGHYSSLRFNESNVNGQCKRCNLFLSGNLNEYRRNLIKKIGLKEVEKLDMIADHYKRYGFKWEKFDLINIILKYK